MTFGQLLDDMWTPIGQRLDNFWLTFGKLLDDLWTTIGQQLDEGWMTFGKLLDDHLVATPLSGCDPALWLRPRYSVATLRGAACPSMRIYPLGHLCCLGGGTGGRSGDASQPGLSSSLIAGWVIPISAILKKGCLVLDSVHFVS